MLLQRLRRRLKPVILFYISLGLNPSLPAEVLRLRKLISRCGVKTTPDGQPSPFDLELRVNDYMHPRPRRAPHSAAARAKGIPVILAPERRFYDACVAHSSGPSSAAVFAASAYAEPRRAPALAAISCLLTDGRTRRWTRCRRHQNSPRREAPE